MLEPQHIKATTLSDAWFQTLYKCVEVGRPFTVSEGSYKGQKRREFDNIEIHIQVPEKEMLPKLNPALEIDDPCAQDFLDDYLPYLMTGEGKVGEAYTYGQRICKAKASDIFHFTDPTFLIPELIDADLPDEVFWYDDESEEYKVNQMELMIWTYQNKGYRNNQMILQVGQPCDMMLQDPPCLRHIDTRIQDGKLHFFPYFRSWDLWGGFPANLAAIELMKQHCAAHIGVENGEIIATSKGLHLYNYVWEIAEKVRGRTMEEFQREMTNET